ncbi:MAG: hypothetical protein CMC76_04120 [Flavobacteriaceae bacterium]|nr:hypothetical protein [Flavobacteriaceae bacterium]|tara:strand:- start:688 stop:921 length:234 start_codon:yes stop_codon:yes gene_type:complete
MLRFFKQLITTFIYTLIFAFVFLIYSHFLVLLSIKIKLQNQIELGLLADGIMILSALLAILSFWGCIWFFRRLKRQE